MLAIPCGHPREAKGSHVQAGLDGTDSKAERHLLLPGDADQVTGGGRGGGRAEVVQWSGPWTLGKLDKGCYLEDVMAGLGRCAMGGAFGGGRALSGVTVLRQASEEGLTCP